MTRHPLQRLQSPSGGFSALLHALGIISFSLSFKFLVDNPNVMNESYGWHWQFLTIIGLTVALTSFVYGLLADLTGSPLLFSVKNTLVLCAAPLEVVISVLYWSICAIDRELVVPPEVILGPIPDVGFHAVPTVLLVIDLLLLSPPWTISALPAMGLSLVIAVSYWAWVEHCFTHNGFYPYPLFAQLDTMQRALLFTLSAVIMTGSTLMLKWVYGSLNGFQVPQKKRKSG